MENVGSSSTRSRSVASADDDNGEVYVAMGEDAEESEPNLFWALCNLKPNKICILHVHVPPLSIPFRSAMFLKGVRREDRITEYQKMEKRKVETLVNGYLTICHQAGVPAEILFATRDSIEHGIVDFITTHCIKKLVMGAKKAVHVCRYAPNFCYIFIIAKGFLTYERPHESVKEVTKPNQESPKTKQFGGKSVEEEAKEVASQTIPDMSSVEFFSTSSPNEKDKSSSLFLPIVGSSEYANEARNDSTTFRITGKTTSQDFYDQLEQTSLDIRHFKKEAYECSIKRNKFEVATITAQQRERELRFMFAKELDERIELEKDLGRSKEDIENMKLYLNEVNAQLQAAKQENAVLESNIKSSNKMVKEIENKMVIADDLLNKFKEEKEQLEVEIINADKFANKLRQTEVDADESASHIFMPQFFLSISISEIQEATRNFDRNLKLLEDDFRCTYRGALRNTQVSVTMFKPSGTSKFHEEVAVLSMLRHPNLIMLMGVCTEERSVVYEHLENGSLEDRLSCKDNTSPLSWKTRTKIAAELCSVLMFLHSSTPNPIVYGYLKPSNVLLDANFKVKLGNLGIAHPQAYDSGHMDPEFLETGELTRQCNVYSYGIILLRLLTGRLAPGLTTDMKVELADGNMKAMLDQTAGEWPFEQANQLFQLAMSCVEENPWRRPDLAWSVWSVLESIITSWQIEKFPTTWVEDAPTSFMCPINQEVMQEPVIASDGFSYEEAAIKEWLKGGHNTSPMTNLKLSNCNLVPNYALRSAIKESLQHCT